MGSVEHEPITNGIGVEKLWENADPQSTDIWRFIIYVNEKFGKNFGNYDELYQWSIEHIADFWGAVWQYTGMVASAPYTMVVDESAPIFPRPAFFEGATLNFAQNLLFPSVGVQDDAPAVIAATESDREVVTWAELRERVRCMQASMKTLGVKPGDRVAAYVANHTNALIAMLAATSLGAIWTAVSTDTGIHAVLERLVQIEPKILFADNGARYNGKIFPVLPKVQQIVDSLPTLEALVVIPAAPIQDETLITLTPGNAYDLDAFLAKGLPESKLEFTQLPPDHPVYILYSSGTTGAPKCIVHGSAGTLIQHKKEHLLHCSLTTQSRILYFTTVTWMMWHWLVSGLASGSTIIVYDGSPFRYRSENDPTGSTPDDIAIPRLCEELGITHFGTSAKYLSVLEQKNLFPRESINLSKLQAVYSTGSPLAPSTFSWVYKAFPSSINLGSITGGTDIVSLFGAPSPITPVYSGEIQKPGLGMAIRAWDYAGQDVTNSGEAGDLVCIKAFPCQPVFFWGPDGAAKYQSSYFEKFEGVWGHGDFVRFNSSTGGLIMLGRSDGILKPAGVRFGSAEIYNVLLKWFPEDIGDALCIGRRRETDVDETVVLFLKMAESKTFTQELSDRIKAVIRRELSARHVPGIIDECPEIPITSNGKKVEAAVKQILCGLNVKISASVANAECLEWYRTWSLQHQ